jgi:hypothetical protein
VKAYVIHTGLWTAAVQELLCSGSAPTTKMGAVHRQLAQRSIPFTSSVNYKNTSKIGLTPIGLCSSKASTTRSYLPPEALASSRHTFILFGKSCPVILAVFLREHRMLSVCGPLMQGPTPNPNARNHLTLQKVFYFHLTLPGPNRSNCITSSLCSPRLPYLRIRPPRP